MSPDPTTVTHQQLQDAHVVSTRGRGLYPVTRAVEEIVQTSGVHTGLCVVFCTHTSASLIIQENADPSASADLLAWLERLAPDGDPRYSHTAEGPDDMPSHLRSAVTRTQESIPITGGKLALGTWQGIFLAEHRTAPHHRRLVIHVSGTARTRAQRSGPREEPMPSGTNDLATRECVPCKGGVPPLAAEALTPLIDQLGSDWTVVDGHHLTKTYAFKDFRTALDFTNKVGALAEEAWHHPDIELAWGKVALTIWTHKIDGLHEADFIFAAKADALLEP